MDRVTTHSLRGKWILAATILVSGMVAVLGREISMALPTIQRELSASLGDIQWMINAFGIVVAVFMLISGTLGDRLGRKRMLQIGVSLYVTASFFSAMATSIEILIGLQAIIGVTVVIMMPQCLAIINAEFLENEKGKAIGIWAGYSAGFGVAGLFLGGWIVQTFGWPGIYYFNIPLGVIALIITSRFIRESRGSTDNSINWLSAFLFAFGLSYGLIRGPQVRWASIGAIIGFSVGFVSLLLFIFSERRPAPLVPWHMFSRPIVLGANLMTFFLYFTLNGIYVFLIVHVQQMYEFSPWEAGLAMLPASLLVTLFAKRAGMIADRIGPRMPLILGSIVTASGFALLLIPGVQMSYVRHMLPGVLLVGLGMVIIVAPIIKSALAVDSTHSGTASGVNNSIARTSGLFAIAILGGVITIVFGNTLETRLSGSILNESQQQEILDQKESVGAIVVPATFPQRERDEATKLIREGLNQSFRWIMGINSVFALVSAGIAFLFISRNEQQSRRSRF